ncbi:MAG: tRNA (adenosine(37)-N6)-threonylcarbamoyltransferase complex dimerization subunit type 1 TsaB, partial [Rhodobacteraceae bacterium]|nr:tRNA (adenosine(37)-N6)-threonylcarbamoyltransferase complex dimerization subunit type 1 TsaB [Paracoccaceae bacterium]
MASDTVVLAFDTSGPFCAAAVLINGEFTACRADEMSRGQAEAIMDIIVDVLNTSGVTLQDVSRIGVGTGPGNFTGIRISVSAARGFALSLGIPAIGVNGFDATLYRQQNDAVACLPAIRDQIYFSGHGLNPQLGDRDLAAQLGRPLIDRPDPAQLVKNIARIAENADRF